MKHQIMVTIDERDGLMSQIVCADHDEAGCGYAEAFYWDTASSMENYFGEPLHLATLDIDVLSADEDNGFEWQTSSEGRES